jgi:PEP-CTERM motif
MISNKLSFTAIAAFCAISSWVSAATIVDFKPNPVSPTIPEFQFSRALGGGIPVFRGALGSTSNNDGNLPVANQTAPGLDSETPFILAGPGSLNDLIAGTTHFYDSQLIFTGGLQANGAAIPPALPGFPFIQPLSPGTFDLLSTGPAPVLLLRGSIVASSFIVGTGDAASVFESHDVTYTAGLIYNQLLANGYSLSGNSFSISLLDVTPSLSIAGDGFLSNFNANATGLFNANPVPEPTSLALFVMAIGALFLCRR